MVVHVMTGLNAAIVKEETYLVISIHYDLRNFKC